MDTSELADYLLSERVPAHAFSIGGQLRDQSYVVARFGAGWVFYFSAGGVRDLERYFWTEDEACLHAASEILHGVLGWPRTIR